ncbi:MAG: Asp-tRNA(Asn)/Glu-tRNA(Gln) amidotransferase subunit GatC, partial [Mycobacteriales bacterium]
MAGISTEEVAHLARLARIELDDAQLAQFAGQLDVIVSSVARVSQVASAQVPPTSHAVSLTNVFRDDLLRPSLARDEV